MHKIFSILMALTIILFVFTACSKEDSITEKAEKKVDQITTKAADQAVKKVQTPINKAKITKSLGNDRMKAMDEAVRNQ